MAKNGYLLWVDDEIEHLRPHLLFLGSKDYDVDTATNGSDAVDMCRDKDYDLILLDENMPGLSGLETLQRIKEVRPAVPVVMVTKSEEEDIMNQAIGARIADYLIKPVNPNQILLALKKNIHKRELITEATTSGYRADFGRLAQQIGDADTMDAWQDVYRSLVRWELELEHGSSQMADVLRMQKQEANHAFARFVRRNYDGWMQALAAHRDDQRPYLSPDVFRRTLFPLLDAGEKVTLVVIDNFRYDQWRVMADELAPLFTYDEQLYCSILPTATQYARNAIFSGLMPQQVAEMFPDLWVDEDDEEGKNLNELPLIQTQLDRFRRRHTYSYTKVNDSAAAERLAAQLPSLAANDLNVVVLNFIDMLSHARTESKTVRELANNEAAYRALTRTWLEHSSTLDIFRTIADMGYKVILTTDHGSIRCDNAIKIIGDKEVNTNLRYKLGKNLNSSSKQLFWIDKPQEVGLPILNVSTRYAICGNHDFLAYPNNYNYYVQYYKDTFQHGGVSLEEMLIPLITLTPR